MRPSRSKRRQVVPVVPWSIARTIAGMSVTSADIVRPKDPMESTRPIFPRLSSGPRKMDAEDVARNQRGRLQGAMVEAVARHGYADTTLRELVTLAGVSKSTFYEHFRSKQDCFLAAFDDIVEDMGRRVGEAFDRPGDLRARVTAAVGALL